MSAFAESTAAYEAAASATVYLVNAEPGPIATIARAHTRIRQLVRAGDDDLSDLAEAFRYIRYRLATSILPPAHPDLALDELAATIRDVFEQLDPGTPAHHASSTGLDALAESMNLHVTALAEHTLDTLATTTAPGSYVVLADNHRVKATAAFLEEHGAPAEVISRSALRDITSAETIICIGPYHFFPSAVWNAGRADSVCFVQYPFGGSAPPSGGLFGTDGRLSTPKFRTSGISGLDDVETMDVDEGLVAAALREMSRRRITSTSVDDSVTASLLLLEGGYAVWTAVEDGSWMWSVDFTDPDHPAVVPNRAANIGAGSYVIFRDAGAGSELVQAIADGQHGAARYRPYQQRWKEALRAATMAAGGIGASTRAIRDSGATTVNLRHWMAASSIRPNRRTDFDAACQFVGLAGQAGEIWEALTSINRAHLKAGQTIRKLLAEALIADGAQQLRDEGFQRLELASLGTLSAYRVVHKHTETAIVDRHVVDEPFLAEERGWHG